MKKKRDKKYAGPKRVVPNNIAAFFGGMSDTHAEHLQRTKLSIHVAMSNIVRGVGEPFDWDDVNGAISMALVMAEMGIGNEYQREFIVARDALIQCVIRYHKTGKFGFSGDELQAMNAAISSHEAQMTCVRGVDVDRAASEVNRRLRHHINTKGARDPEIYKLLSKEAKTERAAQ